MLAAGPSSTETSSWRHSSPMAAPRASIRSGSKLQAVAQAGGKQVAGTDWLSPRWSASAACLRKPWGPSVTMTGLSPSRSTPWVCQKSCPPQREAFSSSVICATRAYACARTEAKGSGAYFIKFSSFFCLFL